MFYLSSLSGAGFKLRVLICLQLIFVWGGRCCFHLILLHVDIQFSPTPLVEDVTIGKFVLNITAIMFLYFYHVNSWKQH